MSSEDRDHVENDRPKSPDEGANHASGSGTTNKKYATITENPDRENTPQEEHPSTSSNSQDDLHRRDIHNPSPQASLDERTVGAKPPQTQLSTQGDGSPRDKNVCDRQRYYYTKYQHLFRGVSLGLGLLVVLIGLIVYKYYSNYSDRPLMAIRFTEEIGDLKHRFPTQSKHTWSVLRASVLGVMNVDKPTHPAVIMLASTIENRDVTHCLAKQLAEIVTKVYDASGHVELSTDLGKSLSPADLKLEFDTTMHRGFSSASKAVVIHDIQKVHGDAAMIFHAFCDNENAPYKDAVLIFTVHLQNESLKENDVDIYLQHIWADHIGLGNADALLSRIGNSVAIVSKEDEEDVTNTC